MSYNASYRLSPTIYTNGYTITGIGTNDAFAVSSAGDLNGDGLDDILIGVETHGVGGGIFSSGITYVVYGQSSYFGLSVDLTSLVPGVDGFAIQGLYGNDHSGVSVANAGDINGDGRNDIIIGAFGVDARNTGVFDNDKIGYGFFGTGSASTGTTVAGATGTAGFSISRDPTATTRGFSVDGLGDINGDGIDDFALGSPNVDIGGNFNVGQTFVVYGSLGGYPSGVDLANFSASDGFTITGGTGDYAGYSVSEAGDINGDGIGDILIGAPQLSKALGQPTEGKVYVVFGNENGTDIDLATPLNGSNGFAIFGLHTEDALGYSVDSAGDVNGDGLDDIIIGAPRSSFTGGISHAYVIFGSSAPYSTTVNLLTLDGTNGFAINSLGTSDGFGTSVSGAGDMNGDGFDDVIIGAPNQVVGTLPNAGAAYVIFGAASGFSSSFNLSSLDGSNGFLLEGWDGADYAGISVNDLGDTNGDGFGDVVIGSQSQTSGNDGEVYVFYGKKPTTAVTRIGSEADQTIRGGDFNDTLSGLGGNDTLSGGSGDDTLIGGEGDDLFIGDYGADIMDGGNGSDTVDYSRIRLAISINLDLNTASGGLAAGDTLTSIENITGSSASDYIAGDHSDNTLIGNGGVDFLQGRWGNDTLIGGASFDKLYGGADDDLLIGGAGFLDILDGGDGIDTIDYAGSAAININLDLATASGGDAQGDIIVSVENIKGGDEGDYIAGDHSDNNFTGRDGQDNLQGRWGDDQLSGGKGDDWLFGGLDNDTLIGGLGGDVLNGGDGVDTASYEKSGAISLNLFTGVYSGGQANGDTLFFVENVLGGNGGDYIAGDMADNVFEGNGGQDSLYGRWGNDTLIGGAGNDQLFGGVDDDFLEGGAGGDNLQGGGGTDTANYSGSTSVSINLNAFTAWGGEANGDTLNDIENLTGGTGNDYFAGNYADNVLRGGAGNDTLIGRWGADTLIGGAGDDIMYGGVGIDSFSMLTLFGNDKIMDFANGTEKVDVSNVIVASAATLNVNLGGSGNVIADFGGSASIEFVGITNVADITDADFIF